MSVRAKSRARRTVKGCPQRGEPTPLDETIAPLSLEPDEPDRPRIAAKEERARDIGLASRQIARRQFLAPAGQRESQASPIGRSVRTRRPFGGRASTIAPGDEGRVGFALAVSLVQLHGGVVELDDEATRPVEPFAERSANRAIVARRDERDRTLSQRPAYEQPTDELTIALLLEGNEFALEPANRHPPPAPGRERRTDQTIIVALVGESHKLAAGCQ